VKSIKMLSLAALAATTMALAGTSSAMAEPTAVCAAEPVVEEKIEQCPAVSHLEAVSIKKAKLLTNVMNVECDVSFLGMESSDEPVVFTGNFTYSNCEKSCKVTEEKEAAALEVLWKSHEKADVTGKGLVHVECGESINCTYTSTALKGAATGALLAANETGEISFEKQKMTKESGFLCPEEATLDLEMELTSPAYLVTLKLIEMVCVKTLFGIGGLFLKTLDKKHCETFDYLLTGNYELGWLIF